MNETVRQIFSIVSHAMLIVVITTIALANNEANGVPRLFKAFSAAVALIMSALCLRVLVVDSRFGISLDSACLVVGGANVIALWVVFLATRNRSPVVN